MSEALSSLTPFEGLVVALLVFIALMMVLK